MTDEYSKILEDFKFNQKKTTAVFKKIKKINRKKLDDVFNVEHDKVFDEIDCLKCANCCKTTSPIFRDSDIKKLSKHFKIKTHQFIDQYLKLDSEGDYVLRSAPCPFLWEDDNMCSVYDVRPLACKEYPHTDRKNMYQIVELTQKNTEICPAVCNIIENIGRKIETKPPKNR